MLFSTELDIKKIPLQQYTEIYFVKHYTAIKTSKEREKELIGESHNWKFKIF